MSEKMTDKRVDDAAPGPSRAAGAAKTAAEQAVQTASRAAEAAAATSRATTSAVQPAVTQAATAVRETTGQVAQATQTQATQTQATQTQATQTQATQAGAEQAAATLKSSMERTMTTAEEMMSFGQGNIEAFVKSSQIWTSGLQDLSRHVAQSAQAHFDGTMSAFKAMAAVKSVHEAIELQSSMTRSALEKAVQDGGKLTDASMKLAEQAIAPITARVTYVAERFGRTAA